MDKTIHIDTFTRFTQVSRETIISFKKYEEILIKSNKTLNLIGKSTVNDIWGRHFLDSVQVIDFIDKNDKTLVDIGSGAGFPGLVLAMVLNDRKIPLQIKLIEKSPKKVKFLQNLIKELNLSVEVIGSNILKEQIKFSDDVFIARAFKPLNTILELIHNKAQNWKKIFIFLGKTGKNELLQASKNWDIEYKQRVSVTSSDSLVIEINRLKKK
jgi:16S rRNA (guanine527-N7)-methyltransferase|tara:strand:+ start:1561 stop:2196 length:636 start_codon:yes stop_codon:yes gene_type:complete